MSDIRIFATTKQLLIFLQTSVDTHQVILRKQEFAPGRERIELVGQQIFMMYDQVLALYGEAIVGKWLRGEV